MQAAPWRAALQLEKLGAPSPPKKKVRGAEAEAIEGDAACSDEDMVEGGDSAKGKGKSSQGDGKAQKPTGSGKKAGSSGQARTNKSGISANGSKPLSNKELTSAAALLAKASLSSHDSIRELQSNMDYTSMFAPEDNVIMATNLSEGRSYYTLKTETLKAAENSTPEVRTEKLKALGPAAASQLAAVIDKLVETEIKQGDPAYSHGSKVKECQEATQRVTLDEMVRVTGTWQTRKAQGSTRKIVARPGKLMKEDTWDSICFMCARSGLDRLTSEAEIEVERFPLTKEEAEHRARRAGQASARADSTPP